MWDGMQALFVLAVVVVGIATALMAGSAVVFLVDIFLRLRLRRTTVKVFGWSALALLIASVPIMLTVWLG